MIEKHIKTLLKRKLTSWSREVDDEEIKEIILTKSVITGGSIVSLIQNEKPNDYDIYFKDYESTLKVAIYYAEKFNKKNKIVEVLTEDKVDKLIGENDNEDEECLEAFETYTDIKEQLNISKENRIFMFVSSSGLADGEDPLITNNPFENVVDELPKLNVDEEEKERYRIRYISSNAITLSEDIQIVVRFYGEPTEIHDTFDFIHTKAYFTSWDGKLDIPKDVYQAVINKSLLYTGSKYPIASLSRTRKFIERGWHINAGQFLKMAYQISKLDLDNIYILQDQLVGVDSAYFNQLIDLLKKKKSIDETYLVELIDRIF